MVKLGLLSSAEKLSLGKSCARCISKLGSPPDLKGLLHLLVAAAGIFLANLANPCEAEATPTDMESDTVETLHEALATTELAATDAFDAMLLAAAPATEMERRATERLPMRGKVMGRRWPFIFGAIERGMLDISN